MVWGWGGTGAEPVGEATGTGAAGLEATGATPLVTGLMVELTTVERAGQSVTVAAHEVMVTSSVE